MDEVMLSSGPGARTQCAGQPSRFLSAADQVTYPAQGYRVTCMWLPFFSPVLRQQQRFFCYRWLGHRDFVKTDGDPSGRCGGTGSNKGDLRQVPVELGTP